MPDHEAQSRELVPTNVDALATVLDAPCPCDHCLVANECGRHRLACEAFTAYVERRASFQRFRLEELAPLFPRRLSLDRAPPQLARAVFASA
jgi:hypothetical protein